MAGNLTLEELGARGLVDDLIILTGNELHDDSRFIAGNLRVDVRVWNRLRKALLEKTDLYIYRELVGPPLLRSHHMDRLVEVGLAKLVSARNKGVASGHSRMAKSKAKTNQNNAIAGTAVATDIRTDAATDVRTIDRSQDLSLRERDLDSMTEAKKIVSRLQRAVAGLGWKAWIFEGAKAEGQDTLMLTEPRYVDLAESIYGQILAQECIKVRAA